MFYENSFSEFYRPDTGLYKSVISRCIIIFLVLTSISACQTAPSKPGAPEPSRISTIDQIIKDNSTPQAIAELDRIATKSDRNKAFDYSYKAAELSIGEEDPVSVDRRLQNLISIYPDHDKYVRIEILKSRIALFRKHPDTALKTLQSIEKRASAGEKLEILDLKASALSLAGFPLEGVRVRIQLDQQYQAIRANPQRIEDNDRETWKSLMQVSPALISEQISEIPDTFSGWLELAHIANSNQYDPALLNQEIDTWLQRHPDHPASRKIVETIRLRQIATSQHPDHITLVLPLTGKLAAAGRTIRDGFLAAYFETVAAFGINIKIDIYDTAGQPELATYAVQQAQQEGTKFIVGPLDKNAVSAVASLNGITSPILALNQIQSDPLIDTSATPTNEGDTQPKTQPGAEAPKSQEITPAQQNPDIYQFTLAPEDEGSQVAERASIDQRFNAMAIIPENIWGNRIYEAFAERYVGLGGEVLTKQTYKKGTADYSTMLQNALNLNNSKIRHKQLEGLLHRNIEFTPRRRHDIDMIFLVAHPQDARQIKPQLGFYYAADIPVYSTSHVFSGIASAKRDKDLDGIQFCDMPWILNPAQEDAPTNAYHVLAGNNHQFIRLYALGEDAFRIIPHLPWLEEHPGDWISGQSGRLSLGENKTIIRKPEWARFIAGIPETAYKPATAL